MAHATHRAHFPVGEQGQSAIICGRRHTQGARQANQVPDAVGGHSRYNNWCKGVPVLKPTLISGGAVALAIATLAGCAQSPIPVSGNFDLTEQKKVRSAGHWQIVSNDAVRETLKMLDDSGVASNARVSLVTPEKSTEFDKAYHELLTTALVRSGRRVTANGQSALQLSYKAQLVVHNSPRPHFVPGMYTALTAGVFALYGLRNQHMDTQLLGGLGLAGAADYGSSVGSGGPTATELILTTTASTPDQILTRKTDVYYIENADATLFKHAPEFKTMKVVAQ